MAKKRDPFMVIPIILNVLVLLVFGIFVEREGLARAVGISIVGLAAPWVLYFIISRIIHGMISKEKQEWEADHNHDFV